MNRRKFFTLTAATAAAWPFATRAQQGGMPTIGLLWPADAPPVFPRMESFRQGLRASGLIEGQNVAFELRYAQRGPQQLPEPRAEAGAYESGCYFHRRQSRGPCRPTGDGDDTHSHDQRRHHWRRAHRKSLAARRRRAIRKRRPSTPTSISTRHTALSRIPESK